MTALQRQSIHIQLLQVFSRATPGIAVLLGLLLASVFLVGAGWLLAVVEGFATLLFRKWAFALGQVALVRDVAIAASDLALLFGRENGETDGLVFRVVDDVCLFRLKAFHRGIGTPFPVKGTLSLKDGKGVATGRFPLGPTLFMAGMLGAWTALGLAIVIRGGIGTVPLLLVGWAIGGGLVAFSRIVERHRFEENLDVLVALAQRRVQHRTASPVH